MPNIGENDPRKIDRTVLSGMPGYYAMRLAVGIASEDEAKITRNMLNKINARDEALAELRVMGVEITDDDRSPEKILEFLRELDDRNGI